MRDFCSCCHKKLLILGAGGHGKVAADIARQTAHYDEIAFLDDVQPDKSFKYRYLGKISELEKFIDNYDIFVAIGNSKTRKKITANAKERGAFSATLVHPSAIITDDVSVGCGTVIMPCAVVNCGTKIGKGVILNTSCSVDHDCEVGDFSHISVGAHLCGTVDVGNGTWVGACAVVNNNINICADCTIGSGAVVIKDICEPGTYVGVPARKIHQ